MQALGRLILGLSLATPVWSGERGDASDRGPVRATASAAEQSGRSGARVLVELEPGAAKSIAIPIRRDFSSIRIEELPDGTLLLHANGALASSVVVTADEHGSHADCKPGTPRHQPPAVARHD